MLRAWPTWTPKETRREPLRRGGRSNRARVRLHQDAGFAPMISPDAVLELAREAFGHGTTIEVRGVIPGGYAARRKATVKL